MEQGEVKLSLLQEKGKVRKIKSPTALSHKKWLFLSSGKAFKAAATSQTGTRVLHWHNAQKH